MKINIDVEIEYDTEFDGYPWSFKVLTGTKSTGFKQRYAVTPIRTQEELIGYIACYLPALFKNIIEIKQIDYQ